MRMRISISIVVVILFTVVLVEKTQAFSFTPFEDETIEIFFEGNQSQTVYEQISGFFQTDAPLSLRSALSCEGLTGLALVDCCDDNPTDPNCNPIDCPDCPVDVPVSGGILFLLGIAAVYFAVALFRRKSLKSMSAV